MIQSWINWTSLLANIATILGATSVIFVAISLFRNRISIRKLKIKIKLNELRYHDKTRIRLPIEIDFLNFTDKEFSINRVALMLNQEYFLLEDYVVFSNIVDNREIKNIFVIPHESLTIAGYFEFANDAKIPNQTQLIIYTTQKKLVYKISLSKIFDFKENIQ